MPYKIRPAKADDLENVQDCARSAYAQYVEKMGRKPAPMCADFATQIERGQVYVVLVGDEFGGYVVFYPEADHIHLENVAVARSQTGRGLGKLLVQYVEQSARDAGLGAVELYTNEVMTDNLLMYPRLGYKEVDRSQQDGFNRVFFRKLV